MDLKWMNVTNEDLIATICHAVESSDFLEDALTEWYRRMGYGREIPSYFPAWARRNREPIYVG